MSIWKEAIRQGMSTWKEAGMSIWKRGHRYGLKLRHIGHHISQLSLSLANATWRFTSHKVLMLIICPSSPETTSTDPPYQL